MREAQTPQLFGGMKGVWKGVCQKTENILVSCEAEINADVKGGRDCRMIVARTEKFMSQAHSLYETGRGIALVKELKSYE
jgi:hypothetical protein